MIVPSMLRLASSLFVAKIVGMHSVGTSSFATIAGYQTPPVFLTPVLAQKSFAGN